jgi:hypothetical protein
MSKESPLVVFDVGHTEGSGGTPPATWATVGGTYNEDEIAFEYAFEAACFVRAMTRYMGTKVPLTRTAIMAFGRYADRRAWAKVQKAESP